MRKFERAEFLVEATYAFGELGCPPRIPGSATIYYVVEILKTFEEGNRSYYLNEKSAFDGLRKHEGMVRYLGDYGLRQAVPKTTLSDSHATGPQEDVIKNTYNIILEYGDLDLDDFFYERLPPLLESEVVDFWTAMLDVARAVEGIHNLNADRGGPVEKYRG